MSKQKYENPSENRDFLPHTLAQIIKPMFLKEDLVESTIDVLKLIKRRVQVNSVEVIQKCSLTKSQWYDTILPKLKSEGLVRKRGIYYELDSKYSLDNLKKVKAWIDFAEIKKSQPEKLKETLVELMM